MESNDARRVALDVQRRSMGTAVALEAMHMMAETDYEAMVAEKGAYTRKA